MREQHGLSKAWSLGRLDRDGQGGAGQSGEPTIRKGEGHKRRARLNHRYVKVVRNLIGEPSGSHFRDRFAARGDNQVARGDRLGRAVTAEFHAVAVANFADIFNRSFKPKLRTACGHHVA